MEDGVGVVDVLASPPSVAVVPGADLVALQARQLGREHRVEVRVRVAADGRVARIQGEIGEVVQSGEQAHLAEPAHTGDEGELDVSVAVLDRAVQPAQVVAVGGGLRVGGGGRFAALACRRRSFQGVQDRPVVLVHEDDDALARPVVQRLQKVGEASRGRGNVGGRQPGPAFARSELPHDARVQLRRPLEVAAGEAQPYDGTALRPVPRVVDGQSAEQGLVALVQLLEGVHEQALAEPAGSRQEVVLAGTVHNSPGVGGLVDIVVALLADLAEGLDADGKLPLLHAGNSIRLPAGLGSEVSRSRSPNGARGALA